MNLKGPTMNFDSNVINRVLRLLRQWGWEVGLRRLRQEHDSSNEFMDREALQLFTGWMAAERGAFDEANRQFAELAEVPELAGWSWLGRAFVAQRQKQFSQAHKLLDESSRRLDAADNELQATIAHTRAVVFFHEGRADVALPLLCEALERFGREHFATGRVLDSLGMVYASKDNFHAAHEFYEQALAYKQRFGDDTGLALTHGQFGRLALDWGHLDEAKKHFETDLEIAERTLDERGAAQIQNHLGQVALQRGTRELASGRQAAAQKQFADAAGWLDASISKSQHAPWELLEAYARKDRALVYLAQGQLDQAERDAQHSEQVFRAAGFEEGLAHVNHVWGLIRRAQARYDESTRALRAALAHFESTGERAEVARTQLEIARTLRSTNAPRPQLVQAFLRAIERAESCRRAEIVREAEAELETVDPQAHSLHIYRRARGRDVAEDTTSLVTGTRDVVTVLFFDLQGSTEYGRLHDPQVVMATLNQMLADLDGVLQKYEAQVTAYLGDGFMALLRGLNHADRAVNAALDLMLAMQEFNRPRQLLGLPRFSSRIGIATGAAYIGNVGTYHKLDYTAIGNTVNLAARLQSEGEPGIPCLSSATYELVSHGFQFAPNCPRQIALKGLGEQTAWDVIGRGPPSSKR